MYFITSSTLYLYYKFDLMPLLQVRPDVFYLQVRPYAFIQIRSYLFYYKLDLVYLLQVRPDAFLYKFGLMYFITRSAFCIMHGIMHEGAPEVFLQR